MRDSVSGTAFGRERCMLQTSCFRRRSHFRNSGFALNMSVVAKQQKQNKTRDSSVAFLRSAAVVLRKAARAGVWRLAFSFFFFSRVRVLRTNDFSKGIYPQHCRPPSDRMASATREETGVAVSVGKEGNVVRVAPEGDAERGASS